MAGSKHVIKARFEHVRPIAANLREQDKAEVWAAGHVLPLEAVRGSFLISDVAWTVISPDTGAPFAMFGMRGPSLLGDGAEIWALGTDDVRRWSIPFAKHSKFYVAEMLKVCEMLTNHVDTRNTVSRAWLRWLGATFDPPKPYGPDGLLFQRFELRREYVRL
ncbi:MAG: hypothetical protein AB7D47_13200 [Desulfovibrio sp.]